MERDDILARLREHEAELRAQGVAHAALFGSRARGDNRPGSDIDIVVELDPDAHVGVWGYVEIVQAIEDMFPEPVDVSNRDAQRFHIRPSVERDAIYAF